MQIRNFFELPKSDKINQVDLTLSEPAFAFAQSGLRLGQIDADFIKNRICQCCKPNSIVLGLGLNDIDCNQFQKSLISNTVNILKEHFGDISVLFVPPFCNKRVYRAHRREIEEFCSEVEKLNSSSPSIGMTRFRDPNEIEFQSYGNKHISWDFGFELWVEIINEALQKLGNNKKADKTEMSVENDDDVDILDLGKDLNSSELSDPGPDNASGEDELNDLLSNELIRFDEIYRVYDKVQKPKLAQTPNAFFKFKNHPVSAFLSNYQSKSDYIFKIWVNVFHHANRNLTSKFIFFDFCNTRDRLAKDLGDARFIITGEVSDVICQGSIPDFVILRVRSVEFWSRKPERLPETLLYNSILDPHNRCGNDILTVVNIGQYRKCAGHVTFSSASVRTGTTVGVSVIKSSPKALGRFDMSQTKCGVFATSEFFTSR